MKKRQDFSSNQNFFKNIGKKVTIYISIIILISVVFIRPQVARGECAGVITQVMDAITEAAKSLKHPGEASGFVSTMWTILNPFMQPCDESGNPISGNYDPNAPTPTIDPNFPTPPPSDGTWPFFCQTDPTLQDANLFPPLSGYGCGQTSLSMVACKLHGYDNNSKSSCPYQPATVAFKGKAYGSYKYPAGTYFNSGYEQEMKDLGLDFNVIPVNLSIWQQFINKGYLIITHAHQMRCGIGCRDPNHIIGHVFAVDQADPANNAIRLRDPINCTYSEGFGEHVPGGKWWKLTDFIEGPVWVYAIRRI